MGAPQVGPGLHLAFNGVELCAPLRSLLVVQGLLDRGLRAETRRQVQGARTQGSRASRLPQVHWGGLRRAIRRGVRTSSSSVSFLSRSSSSCFSLAFCFLASAAACNAAPGVDDGRGSVVAMDARMGGALRAGAFLRAISFSFLSCSFCSASNFLFSFSAWMSTGSLDTSAVPASCNCVRWRFSASCGIFPFRWAKLSATLALRSREWRVMVARGLLLMCEGKCVGKVRCTGKAHSRSLAAAMPFFTTSVSSVRAASAKMPSKASVAFASSSFWALTSGDSSTFAGVSGVFAFVLDLDFDLDLDLDLGFLPPPPSSLSPSLVWSSSDGMSSSSLDSPAGITNCATRGVASFYTNSSLTCPYPNLWAATCRFIGLSEGGKL